MMIIKQWFLLISFVTLICFGHTQLHQDEAKAVVQILDKLGGRLLDSREDPCLSGKLPLDIKKEPEKYQNNNIACNLQLGNFSHITNIGLKFLGLQGRLPPELANLTFLQEIDFTGNFLSGTLPKEWASLQHLKSLYLAGNNLSGEIPTEWGRLTNLTILSLEANQLSGTIPEELGNLVNLYQLELSSNQFSGSLPTTLAKMKNMTKLRISDNKFTGRVPEFIEEWTNLKRLEMYSSGLEGPIPEAIFRLGNLMDLRITDMIGPPFKFPNLTRPITGKNFTNLILRKLNMSGSIPREAFGVRNVLDLTFNKLNGGIHISDPIENYIFFSGNMLSWDIPQSFLGTQVPIDISYNNFTMDGCPSGSNYLNIYRSVRNGTKGELRSCSPSCQNYYRSLHINCGGPDATVNNTVYESDNPQASVNENGAALHYDRGTKWGFISAGCFMDKEDKEAGYTIKSNKTSLMRYPKLYSTARAAPLFLTYYSNCLENANYTVNLHFAEILFRDEEISNRAGRRLFDIYIQGTIAWKDFDIKDIANGTGKEIIKSFNTTVTDNMLEIRLYWAGKGTTCIPDRGDYGPIISAIVVCQGFQTNCDEPKRTSKLPIVIGVIASVLFLFLCVMGVFCKRYFGHKNTRELDLKGLNLQAGTFALRQLRAATNNFDPANKIGEGGFGSVYKGQLSDGTFIAVKQLSSKSRQGNREFVNEIGMISGLQHPNLVKLFGCCAMGNQLLLVYEFMENNCLAHALFDSESPLKLDWATRQKICVGIARGLAFLHDESTLRIVHRDIKATNVLLDKELNAKISDFGLAKLKEDDNTHISTRIAGTMGYMAPEYALWGYLTEKADVYSFGVVALETVSGKNNASYRAQSGSVCLVDWAFYLKQKGKLMEMVDPKLENEFNKYEVERMIKVALLCCNASSALRPTMSEVVSMLKTQAVIPEVISDPSIYDNDLQLKKLKCQHQQMHDPNSSGSGTSMFVSVFSDKIGIGSSTTADDLYSVNSEVIGNLTSAHGLDPVSSETVSLKLSECSPG